MNKIIVLAGGTSPEREVSLSSGAAVAAALGESGFETEMMDPAEPGFARALGSARDVHAVFIALHGAGGEDGRIQGFLETLGLHYTGSGVLAGALSFNKVMAKKVFSLAGLPTPPFCRRGDFPLVVKPVSGGSSLGVSVAGNPAELERAVEQARAYGAGFMLERFIEGTEVAVGILGDEDPVALPAIEIIPEGGFYDYRAKYSAGGSRHVIPPRLPGPAVAAACRIVLEAHRELGCRSFSRGDVIVDAAGRPWLIEINTIPGFTPTSLFPEAARAAGIPMPELVSGIVRMARARQEKHAGGHAPAARAGPESIRLSEE